MTSTATPRKRGAWKLLISAAMFLIVLLVVGVFLKSWVDMSSLNHVGATLERARPWLTAWRLAIFGLVIGYWPRWITWLAKAKQWDKDKHQYWLNLRGRIALWWLVIELFVMQNTLGIVLGWLL